jgi:pimeloyl-ACP methyl ester carboxylesterase
MGEQFCTLADGHEVCFETFGDPSDPALLLTMGLATQMLGWHEDFCNALAGRGFHVIRYDNRDVGRSQTMTGRVPSTLELLRRDKRAASYTLEDMAADGIGVLDHLGIDRAHVVGASMGGMIVQTLAARFPDRVLSLVSMMSNTGARWSGQPSPRLYHVLLKNPPRDRAGY